ncbi:MAG: HD domain-containing protein [Gemmatimonadetes bacterium]|nr:HD domain-containing protein [Gemmatimonadota bacterium]
MRPVAYLALPAASMDLEFVVRGGPLDGRAFALAEGQPLTVGRALQCDIQLDDEGVSRRHCTVTPRDGEVSVRDLDSVNGTFVNDAQVTTAMLKPGDRLRLGRTLLELREALPRAVAAPPMLALTAETTATRTIVRKQIDPGRLDWLVTTPPRAEEAALLRRAERHLAAVHEVSDLLSRARDVPSLFATILDTVLKVTDADRAALMLRREGAAEAGRGDVALAAARVRRGREEPEFAVSRTVVRDVLESGISTLSHDALADARYQAGESIVLQGIRSVMCAPLRTTDAILGALYADSRSATGKFGEADLELLAAVGNQAGIALHRARLLADLERLFLDTIRAIAATIDAKDGYTHRHSERVAALAVRIARAIGLSDDEQRMVELAGLLHDVGKIGVPESILNKPGRLDTGELTDMQKHPVIGARILSHIQNPQIAALLPAVEHHHEKWDGTGYPDGLKGEAIPILARVLGMADFLDALTSARSYRSALHMDEAIRMLRDAAGTHFDHTLVEAVVRLHERGELALPKEPGPALPSIAPA